jgi:hypothetical protein
VGRRPLLEQGHEATAKKLVDIVTPAAAEIAGLRKQLGSLHEGVRPTWSCSSAASGTPG